MTQITDDDLLQLSLQNPELRYERNADGTLETYPLSGGIAGNVIIKAATQLFNHVEHHNLGEVFNSSTGFKLLDSSVRSPSIAFVAKNRLPNNWEIDDKFLELAPDFVIEVSTKADDTTRLQIKMREYMQNGVKLGWLVDIRLKQVVIFHNSGLARLCPGDSILDAGDVVPRFSFDFGKLW